MSTFIAIIICFVAVGSFSDLSILMIHTQAAATTTNTTNSFSYPVSHEVRLLRMLESRYAEVGQAARPINDSSRAISIAFGMRLIQMDIDEKLQVLKTSVWLRVAWYDEILRWNPEEYGGIKHQTFPWEKAWLPDIAIVNTGDADIKMRPADLMVRNTGKIFWAPHHQYQSACLIDVTNYPYDRHSCDMWFQSMAIYSWNLNITVYKNSPWDLETYLSSFKESQEWEVKANTTERIEESRDEGVMLKFSRRPALRFTLTVERRPGYKGYLLMLPCVFLSAMTLVVFWMPPERPDRNTLAMSLFASFIVLLLILVETAPPSAASVPTLCLYYACNLSLIVCSVFLSSCTIYVCQQGNTHKHVPRPLKLMLADILSRPMLLHHRVKILNPWTNKTHTAGSNKCSKKVKDEEFDPIATNSNTNNCRDVQEGGGGNEGGGAEAGGGGGGGGAVKSNPEDDARRKAQWRLLASVMDRMFFLVFLIANILSLVFLFPKPSVYEAK